jgi:hypothetical protein
VLHPPTITRPAVLWIGAAKPTLIRVAYAAPTPILLRLFLLATANRRRNRCGAYLAAAILF